MDINCQDIKSQVNLFSFIFQQLEFIKIVSIANIKQSMAYLPTTKSQYQSFNLKTAESILQFYGTPIRQMLLLPKPEKLKPKQLNFSNIMQVVLFFRNWKNQPAAVSQQMRENKWTDTDISSFCFNCQFVEYLVDLHASVTKQDSSSSEIRQIKHWYRKLSLFIQKEAIKITKHDLKKSDIKNLQQIYAESRNFINNFKQRSQNITEYSENVLNLTKNILITKKYEKLSIITFAMSFTAMFIILCTVQYLYVVNEIMYISNILNAENKAKLRQLWSFNSISGLIINSFIIVLTLFFVIKKFSSYLESAFTRLSGLDFETKGKELLKEEQIRNKK